MNGISWNIKESGGGSIMIVNNDISKLRENIKELVGQHVVIRCNKGKRKTTVNKGKLESAYSSVFVVKLSDEISNVSRTASFNYTDLLTKRVEFLAKGDKATNDFIINED